MPIGSVVPNFPDFDDAEADAQLQQILANEMAENAKKEENTEKADGGEK